MSSYSVPSTAKERLDDFNRLIQEFNEEHTLLTEKQKKVAGHRARKALLSISKLTRFIRKDIQVTLESLAAKKGSDENAPEVAQNTDVIETVEPNDTEDVIETVEPNDTETIETPELEKENG
jgi:hypothetical protein